ncbi:MAG: N-acetylmuramoyl-L-alanine amidase [Erysipelotrichaceae bacterium]|nr:N-acetylmuramoyl-L-alanine amidase [Erysipelotrichaceae bacterium]
MNTAPIKKKKRRLRWQIKLALAVIGVLVLCLFVKSCFFSSNSADKKTVQESETAAAPAEPQIKVPVVPQANEPVVPLTKDVTILLDPGHGGYDPGNMVGDIVESNINLAAAKACAAKLESLNPHIKVAMTRTSDEVSWPNDEVGDLTARVDLQESTHADYFVSIHSNSYTDPSAKGFAFYVKDTDAAGQGLAASITEAFTKAGWSREQGTLFTKYNPIQVVSEAKIPAILVEMGYMSNPEELAALSDSQVQNALGETIAVGIYNYLINPADTSQTSEQAAH